MPKAHSNQQHQVSKRSKLQSAIERLLTSKEQQRTEDYYLGLAQGRDAGLRFLTYRDVCAIAAISLSKGCENGIYSSLREAVDADRELSEDELHDYYFGDDRNRPSDALVHGFIIGVQQLYAVVGHRI